MNNPAETIKIVIVGGGFGGVYTLKNLHKTFCGNRKVKIYLVSEKNYFLFTPLLHEVATGAINPENIVEPIRKVLGCCLAKFYLGKVKKIHLADKAIEVGEDKIPYDYLVLAPGAETNFYNIPGAEKYSFPLKSLEHAVKIKNHSILQIEKATHIKDRTERKKKLAFVVVGGGATGVEFATELEEFIKETFVHYYPREVIEDVSITLVQKNKDLLPQFDPKLRQKSLEVIKKKGVSVLLDTKVEEVKESEIILNNGSKIDTETVIWVAGIKPVGIEFDKTVEKSADGKIMVNEFLQMEESPEIFVVGDNAKIIYKDKNVSPPALAQVVIKQASVVASNIKLSIENKTLSPFIYKSSGSLVSLGQWMAIGEVAHFIFSGKTTWWLWRTVYLFKLLSWKKKVKVAIDWTINIFLPRDISQI
ncbi:NAD(P)/FAD-dependent oxidoreductase [Candidatus Nomurabacteria bacterium]|nr:NAD(P)/FAD-dependent oxidoreductase [Candidatus Nomurabacteria bacterium]